MADYNSWVLKPNVAAFGVKISTRSISAPARYRLRSTKRSADSALCQRSLQPKWSTPTSTGAGGGLKVEHVGSSRLDRRLLSRSGLHQSRRMHSFDSARCGESTARDSFEPRVSWFALRFGFAPRSCGQHFALGRKPVLFGFAVRTTMCLPQFVCALANSVCVVH